MLNNIFKKFVSISVLGVVLLPMQFVQASTTSSDSLNEVVNNFMAAESVDFAVDVDVESDNDQIEQPVKIHVDFDGITEFDRIGAFDFGLLTTDEHGESQESFGSVILTEDKAYFSENGNDWYFLDKESLVYSSSGEAEQDVEEMKTFMQEFIDYGVIEYQLESIEVVNGKTAARYSYQVSGDHLFSYLVVNEVIPKESVEARTFFDSLVIDGSVWIDVSEMLPVKFTLNVAMNPNETSYTTLDVSVLFNSFNKPVSIDEPENAVSLNEYQSDESEDFNISSAEHLISDMDTDGDGLSNEEEVSTWNTNPLNSDSDSDGYSDSAEVVNGYNPNGSGKLDSDHDGLTDYEELNVWNSNSHLSDSDLDGYSDYTEVVNGYNPNGSGKLDSDSDGLSDYAEMTIHWTDRFDSDSDDDGYSDGVEIANGYNPNGTGRW